MWRIAKQFAFSASHVLDTLPAEHPCSRLHGHNYSVEVVMAGDRLDEHGFVIDYKLLDEAVWPFIRDRLDHRHLNDVLPCTSAEAIARAIWEAADDALRPGPARVEWVRVSETPKTWAEFP